MKDVAKSLNFTTDASLHYIKAGSDHHKMWVILDASFIAFADELMIPYIRRCLSLDQQITVNGFWKFSKMVKDPNYLYCIEMVFSYLLSFMQLRKGSRSGDPQAIRSSVLKIIPLFFGTKHSIYQELLLNDLLVHQRAPPETLECIRNTYTMSRTK